MRSATHSHLPDGRIRALREASVRVSPRPKYHRYCAVSAEASDPGWGNGS